MPSFVTDKIALTNKVFAGIFTLEAIIRINGMRAKYFKENWNLFDFFIVLISLLSILLESLLGVGVGSQTTLVRAFRVMRVLRLIKRAKVLKIIIDTFIVTLPSLANVGGLLLLIVYIYAVLGVQLFAEIKF